MFMLSQQKTNCFDAIGQSLLLWRKTLLAVLPFSMAVAILNGIPLYLHDVLHDKRIFIASFIFTSMLSLIPYASIYAMQYNLANNQDIKRSQGLAIGLLKFPRILLLTCLLVGILCLPVFTGLLAFFAFKSFALLFLFLLFFIWIEIYLSLSFPLFINDNKTVVESVRTSYLLIKNHWWYTAGVVFFVFALNLFLHLLVKAVTQQHFMALIIDMFIMPLHIAATIVLLSQLKLGKQAL